MRFINMLVCLYFFTQNLCFAFFHLEDTDITNQMQAPYRLWMLRAMVGTEFLTSIRFMGAYGPIRGENDPHSPLIYAPINVKLNLERKKKKEICEKYQQPCEQEAIVCLEKQLYDVQRKIKTWRKKRKTRTTTTSDATPQSLQVIDAAEDTTRETNDLQRIHEELKDDLDILQQTFDDVPYTAISAWLQMLFPSPNFMHLIANQRNKTPLTSLFLEDNLQTLNTLIDRIAKFTTPMADGFETEIYQLLTTNTFLKFEKKTNKHKAAFQTEARHFASILTKALQEEEQIANPDHLEQQLYPQDIVITAFFSYILFYLDATGFQKLSTLMKPCAQRTPHERWDIKNYELWKQQPSLLRYDTPYGEAQLAFMCKAYNIYDRLIPTLPKYRSGVRAMGGPSFYDCGENALLSFFIIVLNRQGFINPEVLDNISRTLGPKSAHPPFQKLRSFWQNRVQHVHMAQDLAVHNHWADVVSDLNTDHDPLPIIYLKDNRWEVKSGLINMMNLIAHLIPDDVLNQTTLSPHEAVKYRKNEIHRLMAIKLDRLCQLCSTENLVFSWVDKRINKTDQISGNTCTITFLIHNNKAFKWIFKKNHVEIESCEKDRKDTWKQEILLTHDFTHFPPEFSTALTQQSPSSPGKKPRNFNLMCLYNPLNLITTTAASQLIRFFLNTNIDPIFYPSMHRILIKSHPIYDAGPCAELIKLIDEYQESPFSKYFHDHLSDEERRQINIICFKQNLGVHQPPKFYAGLHLPYCFWDSFENPIDIAINNDNANALSFMVARNFDVNSHYRQRIPLHQAIIKNNLAITTLLLQANADTTCRNKDGFSPLFIALERHQNIHLLQQLIAYKADIHERRADGSTILHYFPILQNQSPKVLAYLLAQNADINATDHQHQIPLHHFVSSAQNSHFNAQRITLFLTHGANPHHQDTFGRTPLQVVIFNRNLPSNSAANPQINPVKLIMAFLQHEISNNPHNPQIRELLRIAQREPFDPIDFLTASNADINMPGGADGKTLLHLATNPTCIDALIEKKANIQAKTRSGQSVLCHAINHHSYETICWLLKHQAKLSTEDRTHLNLKMLIEYAPHIDKDENGNNLFHLVMMDKNIASSREYLNKMIDCQIDINEKNNAGLTPLDIAFQYQTEEFLFNYALARNQEKLQNLILSHQSIDLKGRHKNWIHIAIGKIKDAIVKRLINQKADVNAMNKEGQSPLHVATELFTQDDRLRIMKLLLAHRANVLAPKGHETALHIAASSCLNAVRMLLNHGAQVNAISYNDHNKRPLHNAVSIEYSHDQCIITKELLDYDADINAQDNRGITALHIAVKNKNSDLVNFLLTQKAAVNIQDAKGNTPLHIAVEKYKTNHRLELIENLLDYRAQVNIKNDEGNTPLHLITQKNFESTDLVELLFERGADVRAINARDKTPCEDLSPSHVTLAQMFFTKTPKPLTKAEKDLHLYIAGESADINYIKEILNSNIDPNRLNKYTKGPLLHRAILKKNHDVVLYLLQAKASTERIPGIPETALQRAFRTFSGYQAYSPSVNNSFSAIVSNLLSAKANPLCTDLQGNTLLYLCNDTCTIKSILKIAPIDINAANKNGDTRLHFQLTETPYDTDVVTTLLEQKANPLIVNAAGDSAVDLAARICGSLTKLILDTLPPQVQQEIIMDKKYWKNIFHSTSGVQQKLNIFFKYIDTHRPLDRDHFIQQILPLAIAMNSREGVLLLKEKGADLMAVDTATGATAIDLMLRIPSMHHIIMQKAMDTGDRRLVQRLIQHKADLNEHVIPKNHMTMLHIAAQQNAPLTADDLLRAGANIHAKTWDFKYRDRDNMTPFYIALSFGHTAVVMVMLNYTDVNAKLPGGETPLHVFDTQTPAHITQMLLQRKANPEIKNDEHLTPLMKAAHLHNTAIAKALLDGGANVNSFSPVSLNTPLHEAVSSLWFFLSGTVQLLIHYKADVTWKNLEEKTPLDIAKNKGFKEIVKILEAHNRDF